MKPLVACLLILPLMTGAGCQTVFHDSYFTDDHITSRWLPAIADNATSRGEIAQALGQPSRTFENGRIAVYRIVVHVWRNGISDRQYENACASKYAAGSGVEKVLADRYFEQMNREGIRLVVTPDNEERYQKEIIASGLEFDLVLVYNEAGVVRNHGLIRKHP